MDNKNKQLEQLVSSSADVISATAKLAITYNQALEQKAISQSEYDELMQDLLDIKRLDQFAISQEDKQLAAKAFELISSLTGIIGKFV